MATAAPGRMTLAQFMERHDDSDRRYELQDGVPVMMAPSLERHGELAAALTIEIGTRLKPPCRDQRGRHRDARSCRQGLRRRPGRHLRAARTLPSVREILVVFSDERRVEVQRRGGDGWRVEDLIGKAEIRLSCWHSPIARATV